MTPQEPSCRLHVILARDGRSAVILRRGPSRLVQVLKWNLRTDSIEPGQWFKGRIYERRCDLSRDGELFVYFAAKHAGPFGTWTAVSRPPYLTAIALWPKGDAWGGGGHFFDQRRLGLNHPANQMSLAAGFAPRRSLQVQPIAVWAGRGEDLPIEGFRDSRDGWEAIASGISGKHQSGGRFAFTMAAPRISERPAPGRQADEALRLRRSLQGVGERGGRWYVERFAIHRRDGALLLEIPGCCWADWAQNGDLLFAIDGRLYRHSGRKTLRQSTDIVATAKLVADLTGNRFTTVVAPPWAARR